MDYGYYLALGFLGALPYRRAVVDGLNLGFWFVVAYVALNFSQLVRLSYLTQPGWTTPADLILNLTSDLAVSFVLGASLTSLGAIVGGCLRLLLSLGTSAATFWYKPRSSKLGDLTASP